MPYLLELYLTIAVSVFSIMAVATLITAVIIVNVHKPGSIPQEDVKTLQNATKGTLSALVWPLTALYFLYISIRALYSIITQKEDSNV